MLWTCQFVWAVDGCGLLASWTPVVQKGLRAIFCTLHKICSIPKTSLQQRNKSWVLPTILTTNHNIFTWQSVNSMTWKQTKSSKSVPLGSTPHPVTVANEGLQGFRPGDCYWVGDRSNTSVSHLLIRCWPGFSRSSSSFFVRSSKASSLKIASDRSTNRLYQWVYSTWSKL